MDPGEIPAENPFLLTGIPARKNIITNPGENPADKKNPDCIPGENKNKSYRREKKYIV